MTEGWWTFSYVLLWIVVVALCVVVVALARQIGTLHLRLGPRGALEMDDEGPPLGEAPETTSLTDTSGRTVHIGGPGEAQLLLFVSPGCHVCEQVLPAVGAVARAGTLSPYVLTDLDQDETSLAYRGRRFAAPLVSAPSLAQSYGVPGTPYVVVLDNMGVVRAKGTVNNLEQVEGLIDSSERRSLEAAAARRAG